MKLTIPPAVAVKLVAALEAWEPKALYAGIPWDGEHACALGTVVPEHCLAEQPFNDYEEIEARLGFSPLAPIYVENDFFIGTPEERYEYMLDWAREQAGIPEKAVA